VAGSLSKFNVLGVLVDACDYESATEAIVNAAGNGAPYAATALAVHGVMTGVHDASHRHRLNALDLVTPDGQPVRWALNLLHSTGLRDRVYGPTLTLHVCRRAAELGIPVYLYGSTEEVVQRLADNLSERFSGLVVAGTEPSRFRTISVEERRDLGERIRQSGARIVFVGLGCPRQEVFVYENREIIGVPLIAVGAAFDFHSGNSKESPAWMQRAGLQWFHRLLGDPKRLWRRYLLLNPEYLLRLAAQRSRVWKPSPTTVAPPDDVGYG
jgi:N-acetylglucosaminyldiphosphoundecaprenol N-acetyl-beta-D-mannosaminyltransferase